MCQLSHSKIPFRHVDWACDCLSSSHYEKGTLPIVGLTRDHINMTITTTTIYCEYFHAAVEGAVHALSLLQEVQLAWVSGYTAPIVQETLGGLRHTLDKLKTRKELLWLICWSLRWKLQGLEACGATAAANARVPEATWPMEVRDSERWYV